MSLVLITGSTDGIGKQTALELVRLGRRVVVHGRTRPRVDATVAWLREQVPSADVGGVSFDLGSLASVRKGAAEVLKLGAVAVLINNAGIFANERGLTGDGIELTLAVNHVGPFLLTHLLAPGRVINIASIAHTRGRIQLDDLSLAQGFTGYAAYAQSKLANVMHALSLAERGVPAYSVHPGTIATKLLREGFGPVRGAPVEDGARTPVQLAAAPAIDAPAGSYFSEGVLAPVADSALDADARAALWRATERLAGLS